MNDFFARVKVASEINESCLCIGLDPDVKRIPGDIELSNEPFYDFLTPIIEATADLVCAYKPNIAFFEANGLKGLQELIKIMSFIRSLPTDIPIILDAKRGDIANTARAYAHSLFDEFGADAVTVNPYMGSDSLMPFFERVERGIFVLCLTSNKGYADFENQKNVKEPLFVSVAKKCANWNSYENIGLVVGATHPEEAAKVRKAAPELPFLMPGIGAQGGDPAKIMKIGVTKSGMPPIVNSSRSILYAGTGNKFAEASRDAALRVRDSLNEYLS